jgi:raffinose/stachyose/melibiose transport system substrate-binding protein
MRVPYRAALALCAAALVAIPAGCGGGGGKAGGATQFTYWSMWEQQEPQAKVIQRAIDKFSKETGVTVKVEWQGRKVVQKLIPALRGGDVPDLVDQDANSIRAAMVNSRVHRDLSGVFAAQVPGEGRTVSDVGPGRYRSLVNDASGKPFLLPYEVIGYGLFFNGAAHQDLVAQPAATWADFMLALDAAKAAGRAPLAVDGDIGSYVAMWTVNVLTRELGAGKVRELASDRTGAAWSDPRVIAALQKVEKLARGGYFAAGSFGSKFPAMQEKWAAGQADFLLMGTWAPSETSKSAAAGFRYRSMPFPTIGSDDTVQAAVIGFAIPGKATHASAAEKFLAYFMAKEQLSGIATTALNITTRPDIPAPTQVTDLATALSTRPLAAFYDGIDTIGTYTAEVFEPVNTPLLAGKLTANQFAAQIKDKQSEYWKKNS